LAGLGDSDEEVEFVVQARRAINADWRYWLLGRVVAGDSGSLGLFGLGYRFGAATDGAGSEINLVGVVQDSERANQDFGVTAVQSVASSLKQTTLSGGFRSVGLNYNYRYHINDHWQIFGEALYERYSSDVRESPIARSSYEAEVGLGFVYVF
jgi:MipA family protein